MTNLTKVADLLEVSVPPCRMSRVEGQSFGPSLQCGGGEPTTLLALALFDGWVLLPGGALVDWGDAGAAGDDGRRLFGGVAGEVG
jgi:hypothetical protein